MPITRIMPYPPSHLLRPAPASRLRRGVAAAAAGLAGAAVLALGVAGVAAGPASAHPSTREAGAAATASDPWANPSPYYEVSTTGTVWPLAGATGYGSPNLAAWHTTAAAIAVDPTGSGYWVLTANGRVADFGAARFLGSPRLRHHAIAAVGMVPTADGRGYWVVGRGGSVQAFGDAVHHGGLGGHALASPIVALVPTHDDQGYWLLSAAGTATPFGDAAALGGLTAVDPGATATGMAATPDGGGYWIVQSDGTVTAFGDAAALGGITGATQTVASMVATSDGGGYWLVMHDGDVHPFGDARRAAPPVTGFVHTVQSVGDSVVEWAMSQIGKPYQWGGTGPNAYDCSGLSMKSWLSVGVSIPRVAAAQYKAGTKVPLADLTAGDLVYWAADPSQPATIGHVAIYLGGGQMVDAPSTGQLVQTSWIGGTGFVAKGTSPLPATPAAPTTTTSTTTPTTPSSVPPTAPTTVPA